MPRTEPGRVVILLSSIAGLIMASLNVVTLTNVFTLSLWESKAYTTVNKLEIKKLMK